MNIYRFSESCHRDGLEPSLCFFLHETDEEVRLTFPTWNNLKLQTIMRHVEHCNAIGTFNSFTTKALLKNPTVKRFTELHELEADTVRRIPSNVYLYLLEHNLAVTREPLPLKLTWIDTTHYLSTEDIYMTRYEKTDHFYFDNYYQVKDLIAKQPDNVKELLEDVSVCRCGCNLYVHMSVLGYTDLYCLNPYCPVKLPIILADMARFLGISGLGSVVFEYTIWNMFCDNIRRTGYPHIRLLDVMNEKYFTQFNSATGDKTRDLWNGLNEFSGPLSELVKLSSLPYLGEIASTVFTGEVVTTSHAEFREFWKQIKSGRVRSQTVAFSYWLYLDDIKHLVKCSKSKLKDANILVPIAITGSILFEQKDGTILKFKNKDEYVSTINQSLEEYNLSGDFRFVLKKSLTNDCVCLINDSSMAGTKNKNALDLGIPVIRSNKIFALLGEVYYE